MRLSQNHQKRFNRETKTVKLQRPVDPYLRKDGGGKAKETSSKTKLCNTLSHHT